VRVVLECEEVPDECGRAAAQSSLGGNELVDVVENEGKVTAAAAPFCARLMRRSMSERAGKMEVEGSACLRRKRKWVLQLMTG